MDVLSWGVQLSLSLSCWRLAGSFRGRPFQIVVFVTHIPASLRVLLAFRQRSTTPFPRAECSSTTLPTATSFAMTHVACELLEKQLGELGRRSG